MLAARMNRLSLAPVFGRNAGVARAGTTGSVLLYIVILLVKRTNRIAAHKMHVETLSLPI